MKLRTQSLICLVGLSIVDAVIPIPIVGLILIFVILQKPPWFQKLVYELYERDRGRSFRAFLTKVEG
jgi:hypothetical protein